MRKAGGKLNRCLLKEGMTFLKGASAKLEVGGNVSGQRVS